MSNTSYFVDKQSNTSADALLAVGFASLLGTIHREVYQTMDGIFLYDRGSCYEISLPHTIEADQLPDMSTIPLVQALDSEKQREKKGQKAIDGFDYDREMERSRTHRARVRELSPELQTPDARLRREPSLMGIIPEDAETDTRLEHYKAINQMKIAGSFNDVVLRWNALTETQKQWHVVLLLTLFSHAENDIPAAVSAWQKYAKAEKIPGKAEVTALQIVNPTTGKGANHEKASELTIGNLDSFWLLELLKFKGFMEAAAPVVIRESKDRKTYVLQPRHVELGPLQALMKEFRAVFWSTTAIKLDILASLRFAQIIVQQYRTPSPRIRLRTRKQVVTSIAQGFEVTSYKDLGSAYATMNIASINLPLWLPAMDTPEHIAQAETLLNEHVRLIQGIRNSKGEEGSEEYELLRFYRDFLSGHDLRPLWKFTTAYSSYLISQHEHEKSPARQIRQLSYEGLETIIMSNQMNNAAEKEIITSGESFQRVADAIRRATVFAQYRRNQFDDRTYEVRYGLGQELMRKARHKDEFLIALAQFLFEYNAETAQEDEKAAREIARIEQHVRPLTRGDRIARNLRYMTDEQDFKAIEELVNSHGSELVGSLLVACGYSFKRAGNSAKEASIPAGVGASEA